MSREAEVAAVLQSADAIVENLKRSGFASEGKVKRCIERMASLLRSDSQPKTAPVGDDEVLLAGLDMLAHYQCDPGVTCGIAAKAHARLTAALSELARLKEAETVLAAWHSVFGTTQLTHAKARLDRAEADSTRLEGELGLERIARQQTQDLLASCEAALEKQHAGNPEGISPLAIYTRAEVYRAAVEWAEIRELYDYHGQDLAFVARQMIDKDRKLRSAITIAKYSQEPTRQVEAQR